MGFRIMMPVDVKAGMRKLFKLSSIRQRTDFSGALKPNRRR